MAAGQVEVIIPPTLAQRTAMPRPLQRLIATRGLESDAVRDVEPVYLACQRLRPMLDWLAEHVVVAPQGGRRPERARPKARYVG